jgi:hypothetical protein
MLINGNPRLVHSGMRSEVIDTMKAGHPGNGIASR